MLTGLNPGAGAAAVFKLGVVLPGVGILAAAFPLVGSGAFVETG